MSWHEVTPKSIGAGGHEGISLSIRKGPRASTYDLFIVIGPAAAKELGVENGDRIHVLVGHGEHHGQLLIAKSDIPGWKIRNRGRRLLQAQIDTFRLGLKAASTKSMEPVSYTLTDNQKAVIDLPDWCTPPPAIPIQSANQERSIACH